MERSRNRAKVFHSKGITVGTPLAINDCMIAKKAQAVVLSAMLLLPAEAAFAKKHSRTRGTIVGAVAGALVGGKKGAVAGAALGNAVQAERHKLYKKKHHKKY